MKALLSHLLVVPVVLPLVTTALLLLLGEHRRRARSLVSVTSTFVGLAVAAAIMALVDGDGGPGVYLAGNWQAPFGIVLVADRLSALMLVLVGVVSCCAALYSEAGWARAGVSFHVLFQIQLMGLNGAFLTGDFFNLFVFFEVMLAASYGLQLHGTGWPRVHSGLHYLAVNLLASSLFLIGLAVLYGVIGTLSMADVAAKFALVPSGDRGLLLAGVALLATAFLIKAAMWPLNAWLLPAYTATSALVAALFAVMTKVGLYTLLRMWTLLFPSTDDGAPRFGEEVFVYGGLATLAFGALGLAASTKLGRIAAFSIVVSSGTLLTALGGGTHALTSAALFYLLSATLAVSALFLLVELVERIGAESRPRLRDVDFAPDEDTNLDDDELPLVGRVVPVSLAVLGLAFMACTVLVAGLPPLSGFIAKFSLLKAALGDGGDVAGARWALFALLLLSGLAATVALTRAGIRHFWSSGAHGAPQLKSVEIAAVLALILCGVALAVNAERVLRYTRATADALHSPDAYIEAVLSARPLPPPPAAGQGASP